MISAIGKSSEYLSLLKTIFHISSATCRSVRFNDTSVNNAVRYQALCFYYSRFFQTKGLDAGLPK